jgi:hypothetical protein
MFERCHSDGSFRYPKTSHLRRFEFQFSIVKVPLLLPLLLLVFHLAHVLVLRQVAIVINLNDTDDVVMRRLQCEYDSPTVPGCYWTKHLGRTPT